MADLIFKLRILRYMVLDAVQVWHGEVWSRDLDERYCCDGRECACGGMTVRQGWTDFTDDGSDQ